MPSLAAKQSSSFFPSMMFDEANNNLRLMTSSSSSLLPTSLINNSCMSLRNFSTSMEPSAIDSDDGGPVTASGGGGGGGGLDIKLKEMSNEQLADMSTIPGWNLVHNPPRHNPRGALVGKVVSDKMQKTVNVAVDRYRIVPKYRKRLRYTKKFMAHDEHEVCNVGDLVMIVPCQKISRHKHFMVREIIRAKGQL